MSTPFFAALVIPDTIATGVEIASAQGQDTTRSTNARYNDSVKGNAKNIDGRIATQIAKSMMKGV